MKKTSNAMIYSSIGVVIVLGIFFVTHGIPTWLNGEIEWYHNTYAFPPTTKDFYGYTPKLTGTKSRLRGLFNGP